MLVRLTAHAIGAPSTRPMRLEAIPNTSEFMVAIRNGRKLPIAA